MKKSICEIETKLNWIDQEGNSHTFNLEEMQNILNAKLVKGYIISYVWCVHNKDRYNLEEEEKGLGKQGDLKDEHIHIFLKLHNSREFEEIGNWFGLGAEQVNKCKQQFENACMYAVHANAPDKYQYPVAEAHFAGMDYPAMVEAYKEKFSKDAKKKNSEKRKKEIVEKIDKGIINKLNLSQYVSAYEEVTYNNAIKVAFERKAREQSLIRDRQMEGLYICGKSGSSKTTLAKLIATSLGYDFGISGSERDPVQDYNNQECYALDDISPMSFSWKELLKLADNNTASAVGSRNKDKHFNNCKLLIITHTEEPRTFVDQVPGSRAEEKKQFYRRFKTLYKLVDEDIHIYKYDETEDKYLFVKKVYNQALDYVKYLKAKSSEIFDFTDTDTIFQEGFKKEKIAFLNLQKEEEQQQLEEKEPVANSKENLKYIDVDDCKIYYSGSGEDVILDHINSIIPEKYKTTSQMKVILNHFEEKRKEIEYQEQKKKEEAERRAKEEESRKTAISAIDLLALFNDSLEEMKKDNEALKEQFFNGALADADNFF